MPKRLRSDRYRLLIYRSVLGRYRSPSALLMISLLGLWALVSRGLVEWPPPASAPWLMAGGLAALVVVLSSWLGPHWAYVQPRGDHLRVQTPIYRLKVSYRRIVNARPIDLTRAFPPSSTRSGDRRILRPFYGRPALGIDLRGTPLRPFILRLFFHRLMIVGDGHELILIVQDWMGLSHRLASQMDSWRASQQERRRGPGVGASWILGDDEPYE